MDNFSDRFKSQCAQYPGPKFFFWYGWFPHNIPLCTLSNPWRSLPPWSNPFEWRCQVKKDKSLVVALRSVPYYFPFPFMCTKMSCRSPVLFSDCTVFEIWMELVNTYALTDFNIRLGRDAWNCKVFVTKWWWVSVQCLRILLTRGGIHVKRAVKFFNQLFLIISYTVFFFSTKSYRKCNFKTILLLPFFG